MFTFSGLSLDSPAMSSLSILPACCLIGFLFAVAATVSAEVTAYPPPPGDEANRDYPAVAVDGVAVSPVTTAMQVGYAHFAFTGKVTVKITAREPIKTFDLSPHRLGIKATVDGN